MMPATGVKRSLQLEKEAKNAPKRPAHALTEKVEIRIKFSIALNFTDL
jgi:hypothetical protein